MKGKKYYPFRTARIIGTILRALFIIVERTRRFPKYKDLFEISSDKNYLAKLGKYKYILESAEASLRFLREIKLDSALNTLNIYLNDVQKSFNRYLSQINPVEQVIMVKRGIVFNRTSCYIKIYKNLFSLKEGISGYIIAGWVGSKGYILMHIPFEDTHLPFSCNSILKIRKEMYRKIEKKNRGVVYGAKIEMLHNFVIYPYFGRVVRKSGAKARYNIERVKEHDLIEIISNNFYADSRLAKKILFSDAPADIKRTTLIYPLGNVPMLVFTTNAYVKGNLYTERKLDIQINGEKVVGYTFISLIRDVVGPRLEGCYSLLVAKPLGWTRVSLKHGSASAIVLGISSPLDRSSSTLSLNSMYPSFREITPPLHGLNDEIEIEGLNTTLIFVNGRLAKVRVKFRGKTHLIFNNKDFLIKHMFPIGKSQYIFLRSIGLPIRRIEKYMH